MDGDLKPDAQLFIHTSGGKKSLAVNLKKPAGVDLIRALLPAVDVVVENMTPRVMRGFGLDYPAMAAINPRLVMCSLTGFGQQGLDGDLSRPCTDPVAQAMSGISWLTGERDGPPYTVGGGLGDTVTSMTGVAAILAALVGRTRTGMGQFIDLSMVEALLYLDCIALPEALMNGSTRVFRNGQQNSYLFPMGTFKATGGYIALQAPGEGPDSPWGRLCHLMDRDDMVEDERFRDDLHRLDHTRDVVGAIEEWLAQFDDLEGPLLLLASERISGGPVLSQTEMVSHSFFAERGTFGKVDYPELGPIGIVQPPFKFSNANARVRGPAPEVGEHTREILRSYLGLSDDKIDGLFEAEVLYESDGARERNERRRRAGR